MNFKQFMNMYDNWNGLTRVNDASFETVVRGSTVDIMDCIEPIRSKSDVESYGELFEMEVVAFGFYDNELCVRVKHSLPQAFMKLGKKISENYEKSC